MRITIKILLNIFLHLIFTAHLAGQIKIHKSLTTEDGLIGNRIISMYEDSKGYIWFGTANGASRWDGINFKNYGTLDGLSGSQVFDIKESKDGILYFATYGKGVSYLKNDSLFVLNESNGLPSNWITRILVRHNGDILFAAERGAIAVLGNDTILSLRQKLGTSNSSIWSMYEDKDSNLYLGTYKLLKYSESGKKEYLHDDSYISNDSYRAIYAIEEDQEGNLFIGTLNGIYRLKENELVKMKVNGKNYTNSAVSIQSSRDGTIYFCSEAGVLLKKGNKFDFLKKQNGLSENNIWSVLEDSNGIIYFGTKDQGVNIYFPGKIETFLPEKLSGMNITAIKKDDKNNVLIGTNNGLLIHNETDKSDSKYLSGRTVYAIHINENNDDLIGTDQGLFSIQNSVVNNYIPFPKLSSLNKIWSIKSSQDNSVYVGFQGGLFNFADNKLIKLSSLKGHNQFIHDFLFTKDSALVIGTHGSGVIILKDENEYPFTRKNGLSDNIVNCLYETKEGYLLAGTNQGGLNIIENFIVLKNLTVKDGLTSNTILDINQDNAGNIYLSTPKGITILNDIMVSLKVRTLLNSDGLVSNNCNLNATFVDKNGLIWIGTNKGVSKFNPFADKEIKRPPRIYLTQMEIFNENYPIEQLRKNTELDHDQNYIKFIFTGINLSAPEKIIYKYRLSDVDQDWVTGNSNSVQYTNLDNGSYIFEVSGRNEWGFWSEPESLSFTINPAWWETWWFRFIAVSLLGALLWAAFQYRLNYLLKLERLRTKIASDLHDEVGSALTQISINADSLSYVKDIEKVNKKSGFIRNKSNEVITMMSDVIWSIDSRNDNLESLIDRIHNFAQNFLEQTDIKLSFKTDITPGLKKTLKIDFRQNVMMIAKEAINNAVKYSGCSEIDISILYQSGKFELKISDNGKGIDFHSVKYGNGLKNMKMRAEAIKGKLELTNNPGLTVTFTK